MNRNGKQLKPLQYGHPRRLPDFKNAWRKANFEQRIQMLDFIQEGAPDDDTANDIARNWEDPSPSRVLGDWRCPHCGTEERITFGPSDADYESRCSRGHWSQ